MRLIAICVLLAAAALAQVELSGPALGWVLDEGSGVVRPVVGIPGSAYLGAGVPLPFGVRRMEARGASFWAVSTGTDPRAWFVRDAVWPEAIAAGEAEDVFANSAGDAALLRSGGAVRWGAGPAAEVGGEFLAAVVEDGGTCAVVAAAEGGSTSLRRVCPDAPGEARRLRTLEGVRASTLAHSSVAKALLITDRANGRVLVVRDPTASGAVIEVRVPDPVGAQAISANEILVARGDQATAVVAHLTRGTRTNIELPYPAELLYYLQAGTVLACNRVNGGPLMVIDLTQDRAAFLIPPAVSE